MSDPLKEALALLEHAAADKGNVELDRLQASALLVDREALWGAVKQLKASEQTLLEALRAADKAMNHMGDILNEMDAVEKSDIKATEKAFTLVRKALGETP